MNKKEKIIKEVEKFFAKHNVSGIIRIPNAGTYSLFSSDEDKLLVLEHCRVELLAREKYINMEANNIIGINDYNDSKTKSKLPSYIQ